MPPPLPLRRRDGLRARWRKAVACASSPRFVAVWGRWVYRLRRRPLRSHEDLNLNGWRRLCVIRCDGLGDLVTITGFLRELRRSAPAARITLVVRSDWVELVRTCPYVDEVLGLRLELHRRFSELRRHWRSVWFCATRLWPREFDCVLAPQTHFSFFETRPMAFLALCPRRVGWSDPTEVKSDQEAQALGLLTHAVPVASGLHEVEKAYAFLEHLGGRVERRDLELWWDAAEDRAAGELAARLKGASPILVALGIGASQANKIWPLRRFLELGRWLAETLGAKVVAIGGADVAESGATMVAQLHPMASSLAGELSLRQTTALLSKCDLFVGNDSGPMHVAAAVDVPVIEISGCPATTPASDPSSPLRMGPYCGRRAVVQPQTAPLDGGFGIDSVTVEQVKSAVTGLLRAATRAV